MKRVIDLTIELFDGYTSIPSVWPRVRLLDFIPHGSLLTASRFKEPCKGWEAKVIYLPDHSGTHVDAPCHFYKGRESIEKTLLESLMGEAVLIDVSFKNPDEPVTPEHLYKALRDKSSTVRGGDIVIIRCWAGERSKEGFMHCKGLSGQSALWLIEQRIKCVGIDLNSIDDMSDWARPAHMKFLDHNIPVIENLINLDRIPEARFDFIAFPLKIREATASPVRAVAMVN